MSLIELMLFEPVAVHPADPWVTAEEQALRDMKQREYERGYEQGVAGMEQKYQAETAAKALQIVTKIGQFSSQIRAVAERVERQAGDLAAAAINSVLPELARRGMAGEMALTVRQLAGHLEPPHLRIAGPEALVDAIRLALDQNDLMTSIRLEFEIDETAGSGRVKLEWPQGSAEFDHREMLTRVIQSLDKLSPCIPPETGGGTVEGATA